MAQTSYGYRFAAALEGMLAPDNNGTEVIDSALAGTTSASIPFGRWVTRDAADGVAKLPSSGSHVTTTLLGLALRDASIEPQAGDGGVLGHAQGRPFPCLVQGRAWVAAEGSVTYGDQVYARITSDGGSNTALGTSRNDADSARATAVPGARFVGTRTGAGLVLIERRGLTAVGATGATGATGPTP